MKRNSALLKAGSISGLGTLITIIPSTLGLSAAVASPSLSPTMQAKSSALAAATKPVTKKKTVKKKTTGKSGTFLGAAAQTQFGPVQVAVTVSAGRITKVTTPVFPNGTFRDQAINSQAIPMLEQEVMRAQSSSIQGIGGASYTSQGFYTSLLSALAKAGHK